MFKNIKLLYLLIPVLILSACQKEKPKVNPAENSANTSQEELKNTDEKNASNSKEVNNAADKKDEASKDELKEQQRVAENPNDRYEDVNFVTNSHGNNNLSDEDIKSIAAKTEEILNSHGADELNISEVKEWIIKREGPKIISIIKGENLFKKVVYQEVGNDIKIYTVEDKGKILAH